MNPSTISILQAAKRLASLGILSLSIISGVILAAPTSLFSSDLRIKGVNRGEQALPGKKLPTVMQRCYCPQSLSASESPLGLERENPWSLPKRSLASALQPGPIKILCIRVSFPEEAPDDPNTTGRGRMDFRDSASFNAEYGHTIDPSPNDSIYFDRHMEALDNYYDRVSRGKVQLSWDIFPAGDTMTFELSKSMSYYGNPDSVESRLTEFFVDCMKLADSAAREIVFSDYQSTMIFHAGSDRQNDVGFPPTNHDLFTGFIKSGIGVIVDSNDPEPETTITTTMFVPEQASQDNRATALNAVLAHEFGHQLGLVDLYSTRNFFTQLGDFALMDNNGFGVGIDFGFAGVFQTFGAIPVYMSAWSRAYLGFDEVVELPAGTSLAIAAAALDKGLHTRIVKIPISRFEYFLIENRQQAIKTSGVVGAKIDVDRNVILGPARGTVNPDDTSVLSGEYDFLLPGNGLLIYHVDESVAFGDFDDDGLLNFQDNDLQWSADHRFITLVEADGFIDLGGNFFKGTGGASDYWNPSTFNSFTPNTNPSTQSVTGANSHISVSVDSNSVSADTGLIYISGSNSRLVDSFPIWVGVNHGNLNPLSYDIDTALAGEEIITVVGDRILITDVNGKPGWVFTDPGAKALIDFADTITYFLGGDTTSVATIDILPINLFAKLPGDISCDPVVGALDDTVFVAVAVDDTVYAYSFIDGNPFDGPKPDFLWKFACDDTVRQLIYNSTDSALYAISDLSLCRFDSLADIGGAVFPLAGDPVGVCAIDNAVVALTTSGNSSQLLFAKGAISASYDLGGEYSFGPIASDLDRDGLPEVLVTSTSGELLAITIDTGTTTPSFVQFAREDINETVTAAPVFTDLNDDGFADVVILYDGELTVLNHELFNLTGFPQEIDRDFPTSIAKVAPLALDVDGDDDMDIVFGAEVNDSLSGNVYALGVDEPFGFPLPAGGALKGAPLMVRDGSGASLAYVGSDGFLYRWRINDDTSSAVWPMSGYDAFRSNYFPAADLSSPVAQSGKIIGSSVYCYPNPATGSQVTLRYSLGVDAQSVSISVFDMTGDLVDSYAGSGHGGLANEVSINCGSFTPGVYRVNIEVVFPSGTEKTFTDLAVVR